MLRYYITDSRNLSGGTAQLLDCVSYWVSRGVEMIQVREKHLEAGELSKLVRQVVRIARSGGQAGTRVLVNSRVDVALLAGADGVHLPDGAIGPAEWRRVVPDGFLIGVSCHNRAGLLEPGMEEADFAVLGPVFAPLSKNHAGPVMGTEGFRGCVQDAPVPVLALGGIDWTTAAACMAAGAAGVAGISLFQDIAREL